MVFNQTDIDILLVAVRHLQASLERGDNLSQYSDIADLNAFSAAQLDSLCEGVNSTCTIYCSECGTPTALPVDIQSKQVGWDYGRYRHEDKKE